MFIGMVINRSLSEKLFGNYWKDQSDVTSVDWIKVWHVINHLLSHFRLESSNTFRFRRRTFAGSIVLPRVAVEAILEDKASCRKLRQAFSASNHVFTKGKRNYLMKWLDFQLVNYFRFEQLDDTWCTYMPTHNGHERNIICSYIWLFRRQRFPHHFTVKSEVLQEYFRMIRLFPISLRVEDYNDYWPFSGWMQ